MNSVTNNYIWLKCYLNLFKIVADKMRSLTGLALALNYFYWGLEKNIRNKFYCFLFTVQTSSLSSTDTIHEILSLSDRLNAFTISTGTVVRSDFECEVCKFTVDSDSNNFIRSFLLFFINILCNIL